MPKQMDAHPRHQALHADLVALIRKHAGENCTTEEVLAVASQVVGQCLAMQDQRRSTDVYMEMVIANIESGNAQVIAQLTDTPAAGMA